jgi:hypothetical protein
MKPVRSGAERIYLDIYTVDYAGAGCDFQLFRGAGFLTVWEFSWVSKG